MELVGKVFVKGEDPRHSERGGHVNGSDTIKCVNTTSRFKVDKSCANVSVSRKILSNVSKGFIKCLGDTLVTIL